MNKAYALSVKQKLTSVDDRKLTRVLCPHCRSWVHSVYHVPEEGIELEDAPVFTYLCKNWADRQRCKTRFFVIVHKDFLVKSGHGTCLKSFALSKPKPVVVTYRDYYTNDIRRSRR